MKQVGKKEFDVKKHVKATLTKHGWFWWMPAANMYGVGGASDILALRGGVFMAIEAKRDGKTPTPLQRGFLTSIAAEQGFAFVVDQSRCPHFDAWMEAFDRSIKAAGDNREPDPEDGAMMLNAMRELHRGY